ncbi:MAG: hypothetical protein A07HN63_01026 [uncultured archaeon A07HN63]|nr:MAG: hypothetical protein A07HN63_01026 [uncultured archaeon A07HN63]
MEAKADDEHARNPREPVSDRCRRCRQDGFKRDAEGRKDESETDDEQQGMREQSPS